MRVRGDDRECIEPLFEPDGRPVLQGPGPASRALCGGEPLEDRIVAVRRGRLAELAAFGNAFATFRRRMCMVIVLLSVVHHSLISMLPEVVVRQYGTSLVSRYWYTSGSRPKLPFCRLFSTETQPTSPQDLPSPAESTPTRGIRGIQIQESGHADHERESTLLR